jgi:hypothetical protein
MLANDLVYALDPARLFAQVTGGAPDTWQAEVLRSSADRLLLLTCRQAGKSTTTAALALHTALYRPGLILLLSPSLRQSQELFGKVTTMYADLGQPVPATEASALRLTLENGARIVALPGSEKTIRGYSGASLLVVDEASRVPDDLYYSIRPMLAVSGGRLVVLSTPFGRRGWFADAWSGAGSGGWQRWRITAHDCPRISPEFLEEERRAMGGRWFRQEYLCSFEDSIDGVFGFEDIHAALDSDIQPLHSPQGQQALDKELEPLWTTQ